MFLIKLIVNTLKLNLKILSIYILNTFLIILFYYLIFGSKHIIYPITISLFTLSIYLVTECIRFYKLTTKLNDAKSNPKSKVNSYDIEDSLIFNTINDIHNNHYNSLYEIKSKFKDRNTLFSNWIHNMKTSITVIELASEKEIISHGNSEYISDIIEENNKLKKNLEECLNVLRLDDFSRDYMVESINLNKLVSNVINSKKKDFIYAGVYPSIEINNDINVYTDKKWCSYIVEQIISNAIKYSKKSNNKKIYISARKYNNNIVLKVKDSGIGISKEDLPRVFDPFFTGNNGRENTNATGIGLYMVKYICDKLGHKVSIKSELNEGTEVEISFLSTL